MVAKNPEKEISSKSKLEKPQETPLVISQETEKLSADVLQGITNKEFLNIQRNIRLQHITEPSKKASEILQGDEISFNFTFNGKRNHSLYLRTTAGQVLPENIQTIESLGATWYRNGILGEFFDKNGNRLIIRDNTKIKVLKFASPEEIKEKEKIVENTVQEFKNNESYDLILEAAKRNIDPKIAIALFGYQINKGTNRKILIEELLTEFERTKDYFNDDFPNQSILTNNTLSREFLAYYINEKKIDIGENLQNTYENLGIKDDLSKKYNKKERAKAFQGFKKIEDLSPEEKASLGDIPTDTLALWKSECFGKQFSPGSKETQQLFTCAAVMAGFPKEWGTNEQLHRILSNESAGIVGRANYTLKNANINGQELKQVALNNSNISGNGIANVVGVVSTAVGLGQLTLSNEKYLPNGRSSIGIPLEEAIGMLRYIKDRYGSMEIAGAMYGKTGYYTHPETGRQIMKSFQEGY